MARTGPFGTVVKLPSGRYRARYWKLGKQVSAPSTFTTKGDARAWLSSIESDLARGIRIDPKAGSVRFDDYAERWMAQRRLRPHTRETYSGQLPRISKHFGRAELRSITPADVRQWHGELLNSDLHPNTVANAVPTTTPPVAGFAIDPAGASTARTAPGTTLSGFGIG